jgi:hypothetical protein
VSGGIGSLETVGVFGAGPIAQSGVRGCLIFKGVLSDAGGVRGQP